MISGILALDKPVGMTSYDVIKRIKGILRGTPDLKIGHGGTLDNLASGVLPILFGEATKVFDILLSGKKTYEAKIQLGIATETDDSDGAIIETCEKIIPLSSIQSVIPNFLGALEQTAPIYSSLKINGKRSSDLARKNIEIVPKVRTVQIHRLDITDYQEENAQLDIVVECSSGTYIRSIARDIGKSLGSCGHILALRRVFTAGISIKDCALLEEITQQNFQERLIPINSAIRFLPELELLETPEFIANGRFLSDSLFNPQPRLEGLYRVLKKGRLLAIIEKKRVGYDYIRVFQG